MKNLTLRGTTKAKSLAIVIVAVVLMSRAECAEVPTPGAERPHVIVILTDDLGYSDVGCYGADKVRTPHIDRLAAEGFRSTDFHTAASICSPSRAAFLTGSYPQRCGLYMGINPIRKAHWFLGLNPAEITLAEQFKTQAYNTFMVGKWHLGTEPEFHPLKQGFDSYYGMPCNFSHSPKFFDDQKEVFPRTPLDQLTKLYTERVTKIIEENSEEPFFLYYAHNYPHTPFKAGKKFAGTSDDGVRGDVIQELDWSVGEIMKTLQETSVADNTIVIFTSDNGPTRNEYARPFRGTKYVSLEGGHRVPFIFHWPAGIKIGIDSDVKINAMDLFPTLSQIIGAPMPTDRDYDGESLVPLLDGRKLQRQTTAPFYYYNCENLQALRHGDWKLHLPRKLEQLPYWDKNKAFTRLTHPVLYNLHTDQAESQNVAEEHPKIVQQMLKLAEHARTELGEYMQRGNGQRATGSIVRGAPIIGNEKDWGQVNAAMQDTIQSERIRRYPGFGTKTKRKRP